MRRCTAQYTRNSVAADTAASGTSLKECQLDALLEALKTTPTSFFGDFILARVDPEIFFDWGGDSPDPAIPSDRFAVRWTGTIVSDVAGTYRCRLNHDDGLRMYVDGEQVVDSWTDGGSGQNEFDLEFGAEPGGVARRAVRIEYYENGGGANVRFRWRPPGSQEFVPVPTSALESVVDVDGDGISDACSPDCDGDGVSDATAIATGLSEDCNANGVPDECDIGFAEIGRAHV